MRPAVSEKRVLHDDVLIIGAGASDSQSERGKLCASQASAPEEIDRLLCVAGAAIDE